jgi:integrase
MGRLSQGLLQTYALLRGEVSRSKQTLIDACNRIEPTNRTQKIRLGLARKYAFSLMPMADITPEMIANWRDQRLREVSPGTVIRELGFLRGIFEQARREWRWLHANPCKDVRRPPAPPARSRLIEDDERDGMLQALGWTGEVRTVQHEVAVAMLLSLETGMRAGEILGLTWSNVALERRTAKLPKTKNGDAREVPLTRRAVELLKLMKARKLLHVRREVDSARVFHIDSLTLDTLFRRARAAAGLDGFTFHDARATAITRLAKRLDIHDLARMIGHRDLNSLLVYYRASASEIAARLD